VVGGATRLTRLPRPFIVCVLTDRSGAETIATMRLAAYEGAHAYELNLPLHAAADDATLRAIFRAVDRPVYTTCRRKAFMAVYGINDSFVADWGDDERMERQLRSIPLGSVAIDLELDTFDPKPAPTWNKEMVGDHAGVAEITCDRDAIARQRVVIDAAHEAGAEVIVSCHTGRPQSHEALIAVAHAGAERGADLIKIVSPCEGLEDVIELLTATGRLSEELRIPFTLVGAGESARLTRLLGTCLGSSWVLAQQTLVPGGFHEQPLVAHARDVFRLVPRYVAGSRVPARLEGEGWS
jgi:Type I 3-dehydroquinase